MVVHVNMILSRTDIRRHRGCERDLANLGVIDRVLADVQVKYHSPEVARPLIMHSKF